jgi:hypothetical protein
MADRPLDAILSDWRAAESEHDRDGGHAPPPELAARLDALRDEHAAAIEARQTQADELGRSPRAGLEP